MAHYAFLDNNNIVTEVIAGKDENELLDGLIPEDWYGNFRNQRCIRTSYNGNIRKNYAGIGYYYDEENDVFIPPKPEYYKDFEGKETNNFILDKEIYRWIPIFDNDIIT